MKRPLLLTLLALAGLAACATSPTALPACDGKHRRPANPHGSVLDPGTPPASTATPATPPALATSPGCGQ